MTFVICTVITQTVWSMLFNVLYYFLKHFLCAVLQFATNTHKKLNADGTSSDVTVREQFGDVFVIGKNEIWAIPQTEIDNTSGALTQNPGW